MIFTEAQRQRLHEISATLSVDQVADKLKLSRQKVLRAIRYGRIQAKKVGRDWRVPESEVRRVHTTGMKPVDWPPLRAKFK